MPPRLITGLCHERCVAVDSGRHRHHKELVMTRSDSRSAVRRTSGRRATDTKKYIFFAACAVVIIGIAVALAVIWPWTTGSAHSRSVRYLGVFEPDAPASYAGVDQFAQAIGRQPNLVAYYSRWSVPFQVRFATSAAKHG